MKTNSKFITMITGAVLMFSAAQASASEENNFKAIGKIMERPSDHTTNHNHALRFISLSDGEELNIVGSPELIQAHCESEKNPVLEIEGYQTGKFLFWGGNLVVTKFRIHGDIESPRLAHAKPPPVVRSPITHMNPRN